MGIGLWTVLSSFTIEAHYNINGEEHGFGLVGPSGTYIAFAIGLFASIEVFSPGVVVLAA